MYEMQIDSMKLALKRYRVAYQDAAEKKKLATDNYRDNIVWKVKSEIEQQLYQAGREQADKVHEAAAEIMRQIGTGARANGADLTQDYQLLQNDAFDLDEKDLESMIERNKNNPTMIRAIRGYMKVHHITLPTPPTEKDKLEAIRRIEVDVTDMMVNNRFPTQFDQMADDFDNFFAPQLAVLNGQYVDLPNSIHAPGQIDADPHENDTKRAAYGVREAAGGDFWGTHRPLY